MRPAIRCFACFCGLLAPALPGVCAPQAQQKTAPAKPRAAVRKTAKATAPAKAPAQPKVPDVLTNEAVIALVRSGISEADVVAAIEGSPAQFQMDADHLVKLNEQKVPRSVVRAMLNKKPPPAPAPAATEQAAPEPAVAVAPQPPRSSIPADLDSPVVQQGSASFRLADHPQKVVFVKSESGNAKEAIANLLLSDVGLNLITMGMASQMKMWNPYFGDTLSKARALGKGLLRSRGADTRGFEYDMLPGTTSHVTVSEGRPELLIPMRKYLVSADVDLADVQPVLLRLETREQDGSRLVTARQVLLKETKKGRFDFKPAVERQELGLEQVAIPVDAELSAGGVYRVTPKQDLPPGEYALVFRKKTGSGAFTADLPLMPTPAPQDAGGMPAFDAMMPAAQPPAGRGLFGRSKPAATPGVAGSEAPMAGFVAFDFRVMK